MASVSSCAPTIITYRKPRTPEDLAVLAEALATVKDLPRDQALSFLQSQYVPEAANTCRFEEDGVLRWWKGKLLPGKRPYISLAVTGITWRGTIVRGVLAERGTNELWCLIHPQLIANSQGTDATRLIQKMGIALAAMGVRDMTSSELSKAVQLPSWREALESARRREP